MTLKTFSRFFRERTGLPLSKPYMENQQAWHAHAAMLNCVAEYTQQFYNNPEKMPQSMYKGDGYSKVFGVDFPVFEEDQLNVEIDKKLLVEDVDYKLKMESGGFCMVELTNTISKGSTLRLFLGDWCEHG